MVSPKRNPGMRVPWPVTTGVVRSVKAFAPRVTTAGVEPRSGGEEPATQDS